MSDVMRTARAARGATRETPLAYAGWHPGITWVLPEAIVPGFALELTAHAAVRPAQREFQAARGVALLAPRLAPAVVAPAASRFRQVAALDTPNCAHRECAGNEQDAPSRSGPCQHDIQVNLGGVHGLLPARKTTCAAMGDAVIIALNETEDTRTDYGFFPLVSSRPSAHAMQRR